MMLLINTVGFYGRIRGGVRYVGSHMFTVLVEQRAEDIIGLPK